MGDEARWCFRKVECAFPSNFCSFSGNTNVRRRNLDARGEEGLPSATAKPTAVEVKLLLREYRTWLFAAS